MTGDGSGADVEPIDVLRGELLGGSGLDGVNPTCIAGQLVSSAQWIDRGAKCKQGLAGSHGSATYQEWEACPDASGSQHMR